MAELIPALIAFLIIWIVLAKVAEGTLAADLRVGMELELGLERLYTDEAGFERLTYVWRIPA